jgi:hypothetical protein
MGTASALTLLDLRTHKPASHKYMRQLRARELFSLRSIACVVPSYNPA